MRLIPMLMVLLMLLMLCVTVSTAGNHQTRSVYPISTLPPFSAYPAPPPEVVF